MLLNPTLVFRDGDGEGGDYFALFDI